MWDWNLSAKQQPSAYITCLKWLMCSFKCTATHSMWRSLGHARGIPFATHLEPCKCFAALVLIQSGTEITGNWLMLRGGYLLLIPAFKMYTVCHRFHCGEYVCLATFVSQLSDVCHGLFFQLMCCSHSLFTWKEVIRQKSLQNQFHWRNDLSRSKYMR